MSDSICGTFMTRHTCDMRVSYASDRLNQFIHKEPRSLIGSSFYDLVHPEDIEIVAEVNRNLSTIEIARFYAQPLNSLI